MISSPDVPLTSETDLPSESPVREPREESPLFKEFVQKMSALPTPEERIVCGLQFMRESISQEGSPRFREFWEGRRLILPIFKENLNPAIRSNLWNEYVELTVEARKLKEILEEQSVFAMEQIDLAIEAMEKEITDFSQLLQTAPVISFDQSITIQKRSAHYQELQRPLNLLNTLASRLNSLRKEVIKTDMRIRFKTKFFKRLSELGDHIFPKRKTLIDQISADFEQDVDGFVVAHFQGVEVVGAPYFAIREEIKALQGMAKIFTLTSGAFTRTRLRLSECWDQVRVLEKEHKKEVLEKRQASSEHKVAIQAKIDLLKEKTSSLSEAELLREIDAISQEMRGVSLQREDVRYLREELYKLREPHLAAQEQKARELLEQEKEKLRIKREQIAALKDRIAQQIKEGEGLEFDVLQQNFAGIELDLGRMDLSKVERQQLERSLRPLKDLIADKKEDSLLNLSEDDKKTLENLKIVLQQRKERRQEIKEQLDVYRKTLGGSNLDFEKAIHYQDLLEQEKERLEKANAALEEIEQKIREIEA